MIFKIFEIHFHPLQLLKTTYYVPTLLLWFKGRNIQLNDYEFAKSQPASDTTLATNKLNTAKTFGGTSLLGSFRFAMDNPTVLDPFCVDVVNALGGKIQWILKWWKSKEYISNVGYYTIYDVREALFRCCVWYHVDWGTTPKTLNIKN